MTVKKAVCIVLGCVSVGLGAVGAVLPVLPTVPLLLLAAFCFARSSGRLHAWFTGTALYRNNLDSLLRGGGMTRRAKLRVIAAVTLVMGFGFAMMGRALAGRIILAAVWGLHVLYFGWKVKTIPQAEPRAGQTGDTPEKDGPKAQGETLP